MRRYSLVEMPLGNSKPVSVEQGVYFVVGSWKVKRLRQCPPQLTTLHGESVSLQTSMKRGVLLAERVEAEFSGVSVKRSPYPTLGQLADDHIRDRKSTRLNSSHLVISYAVF